MGGAQRGQLRRRTSGPAAGEDVGDQNYSGSEGQGRGRGCTVTKRNGGSGGYEGCQRDRGP